MANLYLIEVEYQYRGVEYQEFLKMWIQEIEFYLKQKEAGKVKDIWKSVGERKLYIIMEKTVEELDGLAFSTPLLRRVGDQSIITITQIMPRHQFANNLHQMLSSDVRYPEIVQTEVDPNDKDSYFLLDIQMNYIGHTQQEFLLWLTQEIAAVNTLMGSFVVNVYKSVGELRVFILVKTSSMDFLDSVFFKMPLFINNGQNMSVKVKPLRYINNFLETLRREISA